jgi:hypothetical protein
VEENKVNNEKFGLGSNRPKMQKKKSRFLRQRTESVATTDFSVKATDTTVSVGWKVGPIFIVSI